jgi:Skp family chaperone for outer membrane proteins
MEKAKLMKNIGICFLCLIVVALLGFSIYQNRLLKDISTSENIETASSKLAAVDTPDPEAEIITGENASVAVANSAQPESTDINALEAELDATESELDAAYQQLDDEMARKQALEEKQQELREMYRESPSYWSGYRSYLSAQYKDLFDEMNIPEEKRDEFFDIMIDQQSAYSEIRPEIASATTDAQKEDLRQRYADIREANETALKDFFGSDYETFHDFVEMQTTRSVIDSFKSTLSEENQLTEDQEQEITEIMYKEQMQVFAEMGYDPRNDIEFPSDVKEGEVDGQAANMAKIHSRSIEKSEGVLSESQFEAYKNYLNYQQEITELSEQLSD